MDSYSIIKKVENKREDAHGFISLDRYIIINQSSERYLICSFTNRINEKLNSITLFVEEFDQNGQIIAKNDFVFNNCNVAGIAKFGEKFKIKLNGKCEDVKVTILQAEYSDYIRSYEKGKVVVKYKNKTENKYSEKDVCELTDGKKRLSTSYLKFNWVKAMIISLLIVFIASAGYLSYLKYFASSSETFVHNGCEYEFIENDGKAAISLVRYRGIGGKVVIPDYIEQYKVVRVNSEAFNGVWSVNEIEIQGDPILSENAFYNCYSVEKINLGKVKSIAPYAFAACNRLKDVKCDFVTEVAQFAFDGCESLENIAFNAKEKIKIHSDAFNNLQNLKSFSVASEMDFVDGNYAIFNGSNNLQTLSLYNISDAISSLSQLFGQTVPAALENVTIENLNVIPEYFCQGLNNLKKFEIKSAEKVVVEDGAFYDCKQLSQFITPINIESVGENAFKGTALKKFDGSNLKSFGKGAFANCLELEEVVLNEELTEISAEAFSSCTRLNKINLPEACENIGDNAFYNCNLLSNIVLPNSLIKIGNNAFENCKALSSIEFPASLKELGEEAFVGCESLIIISVPKTVEKIGKGVFSNCSSLSDLTLPFFGESLDTNGTFVHFFTKSVNVPSNLKKVTVLEGNLAENAFANCVNLEEVVILDGLKKISNSAFSNCRSLKTIIFPNVLEEICINAFENCISLEKFSIPNSVTKVEEGIFKGCAALKELSLPFMGSSNSEFDATNIGYYFSSYNSNDSVPASLKKVEIRGGRIIDGAFSSCSNIEEINILNVKQIGTYAFYNCNNLKNVNLPNNLTEIPQYAFGECFSLSDLHLPDALKTIGLYAFSNCYQLKSITLPDGLTQIDNGAFNGCLHLYQVENKSKLTIVKGEKYNGNVAQNALVVASNGETPQVVKYKDYRFLKSDNNWYLVDFDLKATTLSLPSSQDISSIIEQRYIIPENLFNYPYKSIPLTSIDIGNYVSKIENSAFIGCSSLVNVTIGENVESIGTYCFAQDRKLKSIQFNNSKALRNIGNNAFLSCNSLENVSFDNFSMLEKVGDSLFLDCVSLKTVSFNGCTSLESIGEKAFYNCSLLKSVSFDNATSLKTIWDNAFYECKNLNSFVAPQFLQTIGQGAFYGCTLLENVTLNANLEQIGNSAFYSCTALKMVQLPDSVKNIPINCFSGCSNLLQVNMPNSILSIGENAFENCSSLQTIQLSNNLTKINAGTFKNCSSLYSIDIPEGVTSIGEVAFNNCFCLELIYLPSTLTQINSNAFLYCKSLYEIYNLSSLPIIKGRRTYGDVAYYALFIHNNASEPLIEKETINNIRFVGYQDEWYIVKYTGNDSVLTLRDFNGENSIKKYSIIDEVFANNAYIKEIVIGKEVISLGTKTFYNLQNLKKVTFDNSSIKKLPEKVFSQCLALEEIIVPEGVTEIGGYAYENCTSVKVLTLPTSLVSIGEWAFYNCGNVLSVTIYQNLNKISSNAFYGCKKLFEIYNLSSLYLVKGSTEYGCIAQNAIVIHKSLSEKPIDYVQKSEFEFIKIDEKWYLFAVNSQVQYCYLPTEFQTGNGQNITEYTLRNGCFKYIYMNDVVIPNSVKNIEQDVFSGIKVSRIYYAGTSDEWNEVSKNMSLAGYDLYLYSNCVHNAFEWTYDINGKVDTKIKKFQLVSTTQPTCTKLGTKTYRCPYCKEERTSQYGPLEQHHFDENGVCIDCGYEQSTDSSNAPSSSQQTSDSPKTSVNKNKFRQILDQPRAKEKPNKVKWRLQ